MGKVRALFNDKKGNVEEAHPSSPVEILGLMERQKLEIY